MNSILLQGQQLCHYHVCVRSHSKSTPKERNLLSQEIIFSFKSMPQCGRTLLPREGKWKLQKLLSYVKVSEKHGVAIDLEVSSKQCCQPKSCAINSQACPSQLLATYSLVAQQIKCWPTDLEAPSQFPLAKNLFNC